MKPRAGTNAWLQDLYRTLNKEYCDNKCPKRLPVIWLKLPPTVMARVQWVWVKGTENTYRPAVIHINRKMRSKFFQKKAGFSLVHEMCHILAGLGANCREWGGKFDKTMFRLARRGAFQRFW